MKRIGFISSSLGLLEIVNSREWRHVQDDDSDFYCQAPAQVGCYFARVVRLAPGGKLHPHTDDGPHKTHIVLETNGDALTFSDGHPHHCEVGGIYETNPNLVHWAVNNGLTNRTHLIF